MKTRAFILRGPAGTGKTSLAEYIASSAGAEVIYYLCHSWTTVEELTYAVDVGKVALKDPAPYKMGPLVKAALMSHKKPVHLIIDEVDKAKDVIDVLFLDFLQNARIEGPDGMIHANPENMVVWFTTNEFRELADPLLRRAAKFHIDYLPPSVEAKLLLGGSYFMDEKRLFVQKLATTGTVKVKENTKLQGSIVSLANKMREKDLDISLSELKAFYETLSLVESKKEVEFAIEAWLERTPDHADFIASIGRKSLAGSFWAMLGK